MIPRLPKELFDALKADYRRMRAKMAAHYDTDQLFVPEYDCETVKDKRHD